MPRWSSSSRAYSRTGVVWPTNFDLRFEVSGKKEKVLAVCRRYVNLLEALVASFVAAHP
jgi:hypothetical protein